MRDMKTMGLIEEFSEVCGGFVDTLLLSRKKLPGRKEYTQSALAAHFNIPNPNAHNAVADVRVLESLVLKLNLTQQELVSEAKTFACIINQEDTQANKKIFAEELKCLQPTVTVSMTKKIADAGIDLKMLQNAYKTGGKNSIFLLLAEDIDGKPRVTKMQKKINEISEAIQKTLTKQ